MPGIGRRWVSLVDTPDLDIMPDRWGVRGSVVFLAGLELSVLHLGLLAASLLVRLGVVGSLETLSRPARAAAALLEGLGSDRGGMEVTAGGRDAEDRPVQDSWWLLAEAGVGPVVPTLPALAALRRMARGDVEPGARPCVGVLALDAIEGEMRRHRIITGKAGGSAAGSKRATVPPSSGGVRGYKVGRAHCETTEIRSPTADDQP